jgi:hypothetical protein
MFFVFGFDAGAAASRVFKAARLQADQVEAFVFMHPQFVAGEVLHIIGWWGLHSIG